MTKVKIALSKGLQFFIRKIVIPFFSLCFFFFVFSSLLRGQTNIATSVKGNEQTEDSESKAVSRVQKQGKNAKDIEFDPQKRLSQKDLREKKEKGYFTGIAGPASSPDLGFVVAGIVFYYWNGTKEDIRFPYTPYLHEFSLNAAYSSKGMASGGITWDAPYFLRSYYRLRFFLGYFHNPVAQYYGIGRDSLGPLTLPDGESYGSYAQYYEDMRQVYSTGKTYSYYNYFDKSQLNNEMIFMRDFLGGLLQLRAGVGIHRTWISDYSGKSVESSSGDALLEESKLYADYKEGKILGFRGGWENKFQMGILYDTRDFEPNPRRGILNEVIYSQASDYLGSDFSYSALLLSNRLFYSPMPKLADFIIASRLYYGIKWGEVPFFSMGEIKFSDKDVQGLGGMYSLRGFRENRFLDKVQTGWNLELRWISSPVRWSDQIFSFMVAPFLDTGKVFSDLEDSNLNGWKWSYGFALRIIWNIATIISMDFGFSDEDFGFYLNVKQIF